MGIPDALALEAGLLGDLSRRSVSKERMGEFPDHTDHPKGATPKQELCHRVDLSRRLTVTLRQAEVVLVRHAGRNVCLSASPVIVTLV